MNIEEIKKELEETKKQLKEHKTNLELILSLHNLVTAFEKNAITNFEFWKTERKARDHVYNFLIEKGYYAKYVEHIKKNPI